MKAIKFNQSMFDLLEDGKSITRRPVKESAAVKMLENYFKDTEYSIKNRDKDRYTIPKIIELYAPLKVGETFVCESPKKEHIFKKITSVRVERLCEISSHDIEKELAIDTLELQQSLSTNCSDEEFTDKMEDELFFRFERIWDEIYSETEFAIYLDPFVWVYEFEDSLFNPYGVALGGEL